MFAPELVILMTTPKFYPAAELVPLTALTMVVLGLWYHFEFAISYTKKTKYYFYINATTAIVHIALNLVMIQAYGIWGALYASFIAQLLNAILTYLVAQRLYKIDFELRRAAKIFASALLLYALSQYPLWSNVLITVTYKVLLLLCFPLLLVALGVFSNAQTSKLKPAPFTSSY